MSERDLFIAALKIPEPVERSGWLDRQCGGDAALRQRIDVLLQAFEAQISSSSLLAKAMNNAPAPAGGVHRDGEDSVGEQKEDGVAATDCSAMPIFLA